MLAAFATLCVLNAPRWAGQKATSNAYRPASMFAGDGDEQPSLLSSDVSRRRFAVRVRRSLRQVEQTVSAISTRVEGQVAAARKRPGSGRSLRAGSSLPGLGSLTRLRQRIATSLSGDGANLECWNRGLRGV